MKKGIFFDLYGTLFVYGDMKKAWSKWMDQFYLSLEKHGLLISKNDFSKLCDKFMEQDLPVSQEINLTLFEKRIKYFCHFIEIDISNEIIENIADLIVDKWQEEIEIDNDAIPVLNELKKKYTLAVISNFDHPRHVRNLLSKHNLTKYFDSIIISGEVGIKKPNPGIFKPALSETGLNPAKVTYVGDTDDDLISANSAGMFPILINRQGTKNIILDYNDDSTTTENKETNKLEFSYRKISTLDELLMA